MAIASSISATCLMISGATFASGALFPPGNIPRQIAVVAIWFIMGWVTRGVWQ